jgi:hypothetical protein
MIDEKNQKEIDAQVERLKKMFAEEIEHRNLMKIK